MATSKYLDTAGLSYLWDKIKAAIPSTYASSATANGVADKTSSIPFGKLDSTSTSTVMTAQVEGISELRNGVCMFLMNGVISSTTNFTLNINGLGAKPVYSTMAAATRATSLFNVSYTGFFVYNEERVSGGCWDFYYGYNSDTNTIGYDIREYYTLGKKVKTAAQRYQFMLSCFDGMLLPVYSGSYTTATTKELTTEKFNPLGQIYYYIGTANIAAYERPANTLLLSQATLSLCDLRYSFNTGSTLITGDDVYLVCVPQLDGSAVLHSNPIAFSLPTYEDGLLYKRLGKCLDTYRIVLEIHKPVYYYKNGAICEWTGVDCFDSILQEETFTFAKTGKTSNAVVEAVKGNTVVWNQGYDFTPPITVNIDNSSGTSTLVRGVINATMALTKGHKYYFASGYKGTANVIVYLANVSSSVLDISETPLIIQVASSTTLATITGLYYRVPAGVNCTSTICPRMFDLTLMFGAGNEPTTVEEFEAWLANNIGKKDYYAYNAGELISVKSTGIKTAGFNQWDEEWELGQFNNTTGLPISASDCIRSKNFISCFPDTAYVSNVAIGQMQVFYYDSDKTFISQAWVVGEIKTPSNCRFIKFRMGTNYGTTYNNDICISFSSSRNGDYEAHWSNTASLDIVSITGKLNGTGESVSVFPDGMKRAGSVYDEIKIEDGVVKAVKRVGSVDLGTRTISALSTANVFATDAISDAKVAIQAYPYNCVCSKYLISDYVVLAANLADKHCSFNVNGTRFMIKDTAYSDAAAFKASLSGVYLYYELETPKEYIVDDFTLPTIKMDELGTKLMLPENTSTVTTLSPALSVEYLNTESELKREMEEVNERIDATKMVKTTYSDLKALRDSSKLVAGTWYRITDYVTTTAQGNTQSAGHQFDVIVRADDVNVLNEDAYASLHNGDTYFANSKLEAWELKYCLDNDAMRFAWADVTNGKGVIYYMKDEWNNECPYDFKNILFMFDYNIYVYAFSFYYDDSDGSIVDASIKGNDGTLLNDEGLISGVYGNIIKECCKNNDDPVAVQMFLNNVVFVSKETTDSGFFYGCTLNTIGKGCEGISFADNCHRNMLDSNCVGITLGKDCIDNSFGNNCSAITLVGSNLSNTFGELCVGIILNDNSNANTFMLWCNNIMIGENSRSCVFESECAYISFGIGSSLMNHYCNIHIGRNVQNVNIASSSTTTTSNFLKNIDVAEGLCGSTSTNRLTLTFDTNKDYVQRAGRNSSGTVRIYCPDDEPAT